jgi:peptidoglycan hydrolase-like protein with peptidoglycan-binding domain
VTTSGGFPPTRRQRPPLPRGVKEAIIALAALPVLLVAGIYLGGRIGNDSPTSLQPAAGAARTPTPLVTVKPHTPVPVVTVKASTHPVPRSSAPLAVATVKPAAPGPVVTVTPAAPGPVVTVKPATPAPQVTVRPPGPTTAAPAPATSIPAPVTPAPAPSAVPGSSAAQTPDAGPRLGPVAPAEPPPVPGIVLRRGTTGADVRAWQQQMARRTWRIRVDGIFGPESERVARTFQRNKGLRIDGVVGHETWSAAWRLPVRL